MIPGMWSTGNYWALLEFLVLLLIHIAGANAVPVVLPEDSSIQKYPKKDSMLRINGVKNILFDEANSKVLVGAANYVVRLSLKTLEVLEKLDIKHLPPTPTSCIESKQESCSNHIHVLQYDNEGYVYVCGSNGGSPRCWRFVKSTLELHQEFSGSQGRCPPNKIGNIVTVFGERFCWIGTNDLGIRQDGVQSFSLFSSETTLSQMENARRWTLRLDGTVRHSDPFVLKDPVFVSGEKLDGSSYVYFFFREIAVESLSDRERIFSRVGRICGYDDSVRTDVIDRRTLVSFLKSQIICVKKGSHVPVYYDELHNTFIIDVRTKNGVETFVYGVFSTSSEVASSSAVCRYRAKDLVAVFETSPGLYKRDDKWIPYEFSVKRNEYSRQCNGSFDIRIRYLPPYFDVTKEAVERPLLFTKILPFDSEAVATLDGVHLTSLVVDEVRVHESLTGDGVHVIFAGSSRGDVYKISVDSSGIPSAYIVEVIKPFQSNDAITTMKLRQRVVFVGAEDGVASFPAARCGQYLLCRDCVSLRDPYCAWSLSAKTCSEAASLDESDALQDIKHGNFSACPTVQPNISCGVRVAQVISGAKAVLECVAYGDKVFQPSIQGWSRGLVPLNTHNHEYHSIRYSPTKEELVIKNYTSAYLGTYSCIVGLGTNRSYCSVELIEASTPTPPITKDPTGVPRCQGGTPSYYHEFVAMTVLFAFTLFLALSLAFCLLCLQSHRSPSNSTEPSEIDGKENGHVNLLFSPFRKKYNLRRRDSANKELLRKKNKNKVAEGTGTELSELHNQDEAPAPV